MTVRRLTSGEYTYAIRDLTGLDLKVGIDASSDSVGGEGFTNFGDVQFMQDASVERYLEAAKQVADHAIIGAGPCSFFPTPAALAWNSPRSTASTPSTRPTVSAWSPARAGCPSGSSATARHFSSRGRFNTAWPCSLQALRDLAAQAGITGRFAEHVWSVVNQPALGYPSSETVARWRALPAPASPASLPDSIAQARAGCDDLQKI